MSGLDAPLAEPSNSNIRFARLGPMLIVFRGATCGCFDGIHYMGISI